MGLKLVPSLLEKASAIGIKPKSTDTNRTKYGYVRKVKKITKEIVENLRVYDFEVEEDHSFVARGLVVHNCVGNGLGQANWYLSAVEVVRLKDPELVILPFWLYPYGRSREIGGMRRRGEGSFGSAAAKAIMRDGIFEATDPALPQPQNRGGLTWGSSVEYDWSMIKPGDDIHTKYSARAAKHLVRSAAQITSADQAAQALRNGYPMTIASNWGGRMQCPVVDGVLLNSRRGVWPHQMSVIGWQEHASLGEIFYVLNSWGLNAHGTCPTGAPPGGFWVKKADMEWICRNGEAFALSQFDGFPSNDWSNIIPRD